MAGDGGGKQPRLQTLSEENLFINSPEAQAFEDYFSARRKTPEVSYNTHAEIVRRQMPDKDISQVDALVALHMRVMGHSPQRIRDALLSHAPTFHRKDGSQKSKKIATPKVAIGHNTLSARCLFLEYVKKYGTEEI